MKEHEIDTIARQYGMSVWFGYCVRIHYGEFHDTDIRTPKAYRMTSEEWHRIFQGILNKSATTYWTTASSEEQQRALLMTGNTKAYKEVQG